MGQYYFQGMIDEIRIYRRALDAAEIHSIFQEYVLLGDVEPDGDIDFNDFAILAGCWQKSEPCDADLSCDGIVGIDDFMMLVEEWLHQVPKSL